MQAGGTRADGGGRARRSLAAAAWLLLVLTAAPAAENAGRDGFRLAVAGYDFRFPRDHGTHDDYKTEWWYFTGRLNGEEGGRYGFELTFFRVGVEPAEGAPPATPWDLRHVALAHFAISDIGRREFRFHEKLNRFSPFTASASPHSLDVFNEGWRVSTLPDGSYRLEASADGDAVELILLPEKRPAIHGRNGISVKAEGEGYASHYYSLSRIAARGSVTSAGRSEKVSGLAWMDHEFGSAMLRETQAGWDWFAIQLDNGTELMLYEIRRRDGTPDITSSGSFIGRDGEVIHLDHDDFSVRATGEWKSPASGARYPMGWVISVPALALELKVAEEMKGQELLTSKSTRVTYWEGAVRTWGSFGQTVVSGGGYVEMTGYDRPFR